MAFWLFPDPKMTFMSAPMSRASFLLQHRRCATAALLSGLAALGCESITTPASRDPVPVIQAVLTVAQAQHPITITWSVPADSPFVFAGPPRPIDPSEVALQLIEPGGATAPVVSLHPGSGVFEVVADIQPEARYELRGVVAGRTVSAVLVTPGSFEIVSPAGDTVRLSKQPGVRQVPYLWHVKDAVAYSAKDFLASVIPDSDSTGVIHFSLAAPDTAAVTLIAFETNAAGFFLPQAVEPRRGNIVGALGVFGGLSVANRVFVWR